jgi:hypothetical protein
MVGSVLCLLPLDVMTLVSPYHHTFTERRLISLKAAFLKTK